MGSPISSQEYNDALETRGVARATTSRMSEVAAKPRVTTRDLVSLKPTNEQRDQAERFRSTASQRFTVSPSDSSRAVATPIRSLNTIKSNANPVLVRTANSASKAFSGLTLDQGVSRMATNSALADSTISQYRRENQTLASK